MGVRALLALLGVRLGHLGGWAADCATDAAPAGVLCAAVVLLLRARAARAASAARAAAAVRVTKHHLHELTPQTRAALAAFLRQHGGRGAAAPFLDSMSTCWAAESRGRLVGVVFVRARLWQLQHASARESVYDTWQSAVEATVWDAIATPDGFDSRITMTWNVRSLLVAPAWRGRGAGRALMRAVLDDAARVHMSLNALELHVDKQHDGGHGALVAWYLRMGFVVAQERRRDLHLVCFQHTLHPRHPRT